MLLKGSNSPLRALIELNQKVISENDSCLISGNQRENVPSGFAREMSGGGFFGGGGGMSGDYDHCINALR